MKRFIRNVAIATVILGMTAPLATGQGIDVIGDWDVRRDYLAERTQLLGSPYAAKVEMTAGQGVKDAYTKRTESFDLTTFGDTYSVSNFRSSATKDAAAAFVGLAGKTYVRMPGEPDTVVALETENDRVGYRAESPLYLPDSSMIARAQYVDDARENHTTIQIHLKRDAARTLLARTFVPEKDVAVVASKLQISTAHINVTMTDYPSVIVSTNLLISGKLPKESSGWVKGLWFLGEPVDVPLSMGVAFAPLALPADRYVAPAAPGRVISLDDYTSTLRARAQIVTAITAIEKHAKAKKTVFGMTAADVRKIDKTVKLVKGRGTTKAGTVGYTMMDKGRRYALRVTAKNGRTYTAVRPVKGKFKRTCARAGGAGCGIW